MSAVPVVELRRLPGCVPGDPAARARGTPWRSWSPTPRNVWQHVEGGRPAAAARHLIMARTTRHVNARPVSLLRALSTLLKTAPPAFVERAEAAVGTEDRRCPSGAPALSCRRPALLVGPRRCPQALDLQVVRVTRGSLRTRAEPQTRPARVARV